MKNDLMKYCKVFRGEKKSPYDRMGDEEEQYKDFIWFVEARFFMEFSDAERENWVRKAKGYLPWESMRGRKRDDVPEIIKGMVLWAYDMDINFDSGACTHFLERYVGKPPKREPMIRLNEKIQKMADDYARNSCNYFCASYRGRKGNRFIFSPRHKDSRVYCEGLPILIYVEGEKVWDEQGFECIDLLSSLPHFDRKKGRRLFKEMVTRYEEMERLSHYGSRDTEEEYEYNCMRDIIRSINETGFQRIPKELVYEYLEMAERFDMQLVVKPRFGLAGEETYLDLVPKSLTPMERMYRIFEMVRILHLRGYEKLRLCEHFSNTGTQMRCFITYKENTFEWCGAMIGDGNPPKSAILSTGKANWLSDDIDAEEMAELFLRTFPYIVRKAQGRDPEYVEWFKLAYDAAMRDKFFVGIGDYFHSWEEGYVRAGDERLPMPSPGESEYSDGY